MMKILIIEDEPPIAEYIEKSTRSILGNMLTEIKTVHSLEDAQIYLKKNKIDLCLLDLSLHGEDGFEVLQNSVSKPFNTIVISAHTERALEAFEYGVVDFVPKMIKQDRLRLAFDRFLGKENRPEETKYIVIRKQNKNVLLPVEKILYFKAARYLVEAYLKDGSKEIIDKSLNQLEIILPKSFIRVHRSFMVDKESIASFEHTGGNSYKIRFHNGKSIPLSRSRYSMLKQLFAQDIIK